MSIKTDAQVIRDETITGANTATRIGSNLVAIADDLLSKATSISTNASDISSLQTEQTTQNNSIALNTSHRSNTSNPHSVTKAQVGLSNVDNTSDLNKPISTLTQSALDGKQATLVSGTNIKTINSTSILGSGDIIISGSGAVDSVNGQTGVVVLDADDIDDTSTTNKFVTSADITKLGNLSGTNTGDQNLQEVTDLGSTTTNTITLSPTGNNKGIIANGSGSGICIDITHSGTGSKLKIGTAGSGDLIEAGSFNVDASGNVVANNLSGTNTGDQDLSSYLTISSAASTYEPLKGVDDNYVTDADITKLGYISVTQAVNLDTMESDISTNNAKVGVTTQISNLVEDTTPQLGGDLDLNGHIITGLEIGTDVQAQITVSTTAPSSPTTNQLWVDIN